MCDVKGCAETGKVLVEPGVLVCNKHNLKKEYHCKFCKVQVVSRDNLHPVLGKQHKKSCPRARTLN